MLLKAFFPLFTRIFCFDIQAEALLSQLVQDQFYFIPSPTALWKLDANFSTFCPPMGAQILYLRTTQR